METLYDASTLLLPYGILIGVFSNHLRNKMTNAKNSTMEAAPINKYFLVKVNPDHRLLLLFRISKRLVLVLLVFIFD